MAPTSPDVTTMNRRRFCTAAATAAVASGVGVAAAPRASAQSTGGGELDAWFADVSNYDGVVDARGQAEVRVEVGAKTVAGPYGFGPAAVRVDPGTTVVWEWLGGVHDVAAVDGSFQSDLQDEPGATFTHTFEADGIHRYVCTPHEPMGMKGAIVVGDVEVDASEEAAATGEPDYGDWFDDVGNYESTVDARGRDDVTVEVGVSVDGAPFGYGPPAVRVSPGTTVTWEWTGKGGAHDVSATDGAFESDLVDAAGHTFTHTFDEPGIYRYACTPHEALGMKGAVVVGDVGGGGAQADLGETLLVGGLAGLVLSGLFLVPLSGLRRKRRRPAH